MADHPNGIYQYTSVNIPGGVSVTFIPNANNTPVVWLVQSNVTINGTVDVSAPFVNSNTQGGLGGPGGWAGGNSLIGSGSSATSAGQGPGGGAVGSGGGTYLYGNPFLIPLLGGSGGGGATNSNNGIAAAGGGGGGAILIAASGLIGVNGSLNANGASGNHEWNGDGGGGSGGAIRLVATQIIGAGQINVYAGNNGGAGRIRFDAYQYNYSGGINGTLSQGSQFVIIPTAGQLPQLTVTSVGGVPVSASPTGVLSTPDAVLSAQQNNPIPIVVSCANLPLNTQITVSVKPANGATVSATGLNSTGTLSSSTATISIVIPRGGGLIYAAAATSN
jgi:hypothetical protein